LVSGETEKIGERKTREQDLKKVKKEGKQY
jgi:hypothetical protein